MSAVLATTNIRLALAVMNTEDRCSWDGGELEEVGEEVGSPPSRYYFSDRSGTIMVGGASAGIVEAGTSTLASGSGDHDGARYKLLYDIALSPRPTISSSDVMMESGMPRLATGSGSPVLPR